MGTGKALGPGGGSLIGCKRVAQGAGRFVKRAASLPSVSQERDLDVGKCLGFAAGAVAAATVRERYLEMVVPGWTGGSQRALTPPSPV